MLRRTWLMLLSVAALAATPARSAVWLTLNRADLDSLRTRQQAGDPAFAPLVKRLTRDADARISAPLVSVVTKKTLAPGGSPHDYVSLSKYFWPNPATSNGLPYILRDGQTNPEVKDYDGDRLGTMMKSVTCLSLAWTITGREEYGRRAAEQLRTWFLDPATRMAPNLKHAQLIPGVNKGSPWGIIETWPLPAVLDAATLLATHPKSTGWTAADHAALTTWAGDYLIWLRTSDLGREEETAPNNHGTWWDVQVVSLAIFTGDTATSRSVCEKAKTRRLAAHIEPDGRLPRELSRTLTLDYSVFELEAQARLAALAKTQGVDLWNYTTQDGRSFRKAVDFVFPYLTSDKKWPFKQIRRPAPTLGRPLLLAASRGLNDPRYAAPWTNSPASWRTDLYLPPSP